MAARGRLVSQIEQPPDSPGHRAFGKTDRQVDRDPLDGRLSKKSSQHRNKPLRIEPLALREHARQFRRGRERGGGVFLADGRVATQPSQQLVKALAQLVESPSLG